MDKRKDTILTCLEVVIYAGIAWAVWRTMLGDDRLKLARMRFAKHGEAYCQKQAEGWAHLADGCRKVYDQSRSVTV